MKPLLLLTTLIVWRVGDAFVRNPNNFRLCGCRESKSESALTLQRRQHRSFEHPSGTRKVRFVFAPTTLQQVPEIGDEEEYEAEADLDFNIARVIGIFFEAAKFIGFSLVLARVFRIPNCGLGPGFLLNWGVILRGAILMLPMGVAALALALIGRHVPALQDVGKAMQQLALMLLGGRFRPVLSLVIAPLTSCVVALSEEMLFRGVLQYEIGRRFPILSPKWSIILTSCVFGLVHTYTRVYAALACAASIYLGWLYQVYGNLAIPLAVHAWHNTIAFLVVHRMVSKLSREEQETLYPWENLEEWEEMMETDDEVETKVDNGE